MSDSTAEAARREAEAYCDRVTPSISCTYGTITGSVLSIIADAFVAGWEARNTQVQVTDEPVFAELSEVIRLLKGFVKDADAETSPHSYLGILNRAEAAIAAALEKREP
jgi:hypothetical protein